MGTLWNTYAFFVLYANIDNFDATKIYSLEYDKLAVMDKWLLSRLESTVKGCRRQSGKLPDSGSSKSTAVLRGRYE